MHWSPAIEAEHRATRETAGLFDESSFAKFEVSGPGAAELLERLCDNRVARSVHAVTYTQMLDRAVREMKGEAAPDEAETQLNLGLNIRIPAEYIPEENQRLRMYKRVAGVETETQLNDVAAELQDRYGPPPAAVRNLLDYAALKLLCMRVGVNAIERKRDFVTLKFRQNAAVDPEHLARFVSTQRGAQFTPDGMLKFVLKAAAADDVLRALRTVLEQLAAEEASSASR